MTESSTLSAAQVPETKTVRVVDYIARTVEGLGTDCRRKMIMSYLRKVEMSY